MKAYSNASRKNRMANLRQAPAVKAVKQEPLDFSCLTRYVADWKGLENRFAAIKKITSNKEQAGITLFSSSPLVCNSRFQEYLKFVRLQYRTWRRWLYAWWVTESQFKVLRFVSPAKAKLPSRPKTNYGWKKRSRKQWNEMLRVKNASRQECQEWNASLEKQTSSQERTKSWNW